MNTTNEDYELVGRWLDGEDIDLTADQRALADEIAADAEWVGPALDVRIPAGTLHRVNARLRQESPVAGRTGRLVWFRWIAEAATVAAVIIFAFTFYQPPETVGPQPPAGLDANGEMFVYKILDDEWDVRAEALGEEMTDWRANLTLNEDFPAELSLAEMEYELEEFILDEAEAETSFDPNGYDDRPNGEGWEDSL